MLLSKLLVELVWYSCPSIHFKNKRRQIPQRSRIDPNSIPPIVQAEIFRTPSHGRQLDCSRRTAAVASTLVVAAGTALRRRTGHSCARKAVAGGDAVTTLEPTRPGERQAPPTGELQGDVFLVQTLGSKLGGFWAIFFEGLQFFETIFGSEFRSPIFWPTAKMVED